MQIQSSSSILKNTIQQASSAVKDSIEKIPDLTDEQKRQIAKAVDNTRVPAAEVPNTFVYWLAVGAVALVAAVIIRWPLLSRFWSGNTKFSTNCPCNCDWCAGRYGGPYPKDWLVNSATYTDLQFRTVSSFFDVYVSSF